MKLGEDDMVLSSYAKDNYIAPKMSQLTKSNAPKLDEYFDIDNTRILNFILSSLFRRKIKNEKMRFAVLNLLRKSQIAFTEYENGRLCLEEFVSKDIQDHAITIYYEAVFHFETTVSNTYQAFMMIRQIVGEDLFEARDGSPLQRLNRIYNNSKHADANITDRKSSAFSIIPVWINNNGLESKETFISFEEIIDLFNDLMTVSRDIKSRE